MKAANGRTNTELTKTVGKDAQQRRKGVQMSISVMEMIREN